MIVSEFKDYYQILGVGRGADDKEIISRFRERAKAYHPDANINASAELKKQNEEKFKEAGEAYACLSDADDRREYDRIYDQHLREQQEGPRSEDRTQTTAEQGASAQYSHFREEHLDDWFSQIFGEAGQTSDEAWAEGILRGVPGLDNLFSTGIFADPNAQREKWTQEGQAASKKRREESLAGERKLAEDKLAQKEAVREKALNTEIDLPDTDRYLLLAMKKMVLDPELNKLEIKDENGFLIWRIEEARHGMVPTGFKVSRSLADLVDPEKNLKITYKEGGNLWALPVEREVIPGRVFPISAIENAATEFGYGRRPTEGLPKGLPGYVTALGDIAYSLAMMEKEGEGGHRPNENRLLTVKRFFEENVGSNFGEIKTLKVGELTKGLDENRISEVPKMDEGSLRDK